MYCPRCSQQQVSEETKFCSRCGLPLGLVSELLAAACRSLQKQIAVYAPQRFDLFAALVFGRYADYPAACRHQRRTRRCRGIFCSYRFGRRDYFAGRLDADS